ncbi:MAG: glycosyltransferase [Gaiellaceae bacterium MAG52_C11]|nr:glycosyltransferase [Candidatus Gaiellasilicea maunaloa]
MSSPKLAVVVASVNGLPYLADCLEALEARAPEAEVVVADWTDEATRQLVRERFPKVKLLSFDEPMAVPELRAAGIFASGAPYVALIEDHCNVREGWAERLVSAHEVGHSVVGGSIRNSPYLRIRDWAAFFCEYSRYMEPAPAGEVDDLPGMNVSYDRRALDAIDDLLHEGRWESWLHGRLLERGFVLWCEPAAVLDHAKDFGFVEFLSQRYHYSRSYAGMRNAELGGKRLLFALGSPLIMPLMYWRIARNVLARRRHRRELALATPLILLYMGVWAGGEAIGYTLGGGRSLLQVR